MCIVGKKKSGINLEISTYVQKEYCDNIKVKKSTNVQLVCVYVYVLYGHRKY